MKRACLLLLPALVLLALTVGGCDDESKPAITRIKVQPACGVMPLQVEAFATASGGNETGDPMGGNNKLDMKWNFGDGGSGTTSRAFHEYAAAGEYTVVVTATDADGEIATASVPVTVLEDSLVVTAFIDDDDNVVTTDDVIQFDITAVSCDVDYPAVPGDAVKMVYEWRMNDVDDTVYTGVSPAFQYTVAGNYEVEVAITYPYWAVTRHLTIPITVNPAP